MSEVTISIEEIKDRWRRNAVSYDDMRKLFDWIEKLEAKLRLQTHNATKQRAIAVGSYRIGG